MNQVHKEIIAKDLIESIEKLLDATVKHQIVVDSYGKSEKRIVITYEQQV